MNKVRHTILPPPPAHSRRAAHFLKPLPIAALAALLAAGFAPQAWADDCTPLGYWCVGSNGPSGNDFTVTSSYTLVAGGYATNANESAERNLLLLESTGSVSNARGGLATGDAGYAVENELTIKGRVKWNASGGSSDYAGAVRNKVFFEGGVLDATRISEGGFLAGGNGPTTEFNEVTISGGFLWNSYVYGGLAKLHATENHVTINDGIVSGSVWGGNAESTTNPQTTANDNTVAINGGTVGGDVIGGEGRNGCFAMRNKVTLAGGSVTGNVLGGVCPSGGTVDQNILNVQGKGVKVGGSVKSFKTLNLTLPPDITNGDTMLEVRGDVDFTGATSDLTISGTPALRRDDVITLMKVTGNATFPPGLDGKTFLVGGYSIGVGTLSSDPKTLKAWVMRAPDITYGINIAPGITGGEVKCNAAAGVGATSVGEGGEVNCEAAPESGNKLAALVISGGGVATPIICTASPCTLPNAQGDVTVYATFTKDDSGSTGGGTPGSTDPGTGTNPGTDGNGDGNTQTPCPACDNSSPTMGELGLLLSGLALAGAAAPALRRREKQGKKADTRQ